MKMFSKLAMYCRELKYKHRVESKGGIYTTGMRNEPFEVLPGEEVKELIEDLHRQTEHTGMEMQAVIGVHALLGMGGRGKTVGDVHHFNQTMIECMVNIFGLTFDNNANVLLNVSGETYSLYSHSEGVNVEFVLYNTNGTNHLGKIHLRKDQSALEVYTWVKDITSKNLAGIISCSGCGEDIKEEDVAGNYFAGRYCKNCWETKYKKIEASENYN